MCIIFFCRRLNYVMDWNCSIRFRKWATRTNGTKGPECDRMKNDNSVIHKLLLSFVRHNRIRHTHTHTYTLATVVGVDVETDRHHFLYHNIDDSLHRIIYKFHFFAFVVSAEQKSSAKNEIIMRMKSNGKEAINSIDTIFHFSKWLLCAMFHKWAVKRFCDCQWIL